MSEPNGYWDMRLPKRDQCCLCGKTKEQVAKLIVGLHGAVCSDCIHLCNDILGTDAAGVLIRREPAWDAAALVEPQDRDVFPDPLDAKAAISTLAALVRNHARSVWEKENPDKLEGDSSPTA